MTDDWLPTTIPSSIRTTPRRWSGRAAAPSARRSGERRRARRRRSRRRRPRPPSPAATRTDAGPTAASARSAAPRRPTPEAPQTPAAAPQTPPAAPRPRPLHPRPRPRPQTPQAHRRTPPASGATVAAAPRLAAEATRRIRRRRRGGGRVPATARAISGRRRRAEIRGSVLGRRAGCRRVRPRPPEGSSRGRSGARCGSPLIVLALILLWFLIALFQPFHGDGHGHVAVPIPKGSSVSEVGDMLGREGRDRRARPCSRSGSRSPASAPTSIPGDYTLRQGHELRRRDRRALEAAGQEDRSRSRFPRATAARRRRRSSKQDGVSGNYLKALEIVQVPQPDRLRRQGRAKNLEGFLFPATFELPTHPTADDLVQRQLEAFKQKIKGVDMSYAK